MEDLVRSLLCLVIVIAALGVIVSVPLTGTMDPWLFLRPLYRKLKHLPRQVFHRLSHSCYRGARTTWRRAGHGSWYVRIPWYSFAVVLGTSGFLFSIPASIFGSVAKH